MIAHACFHIIHGLSHIIHTLIKRFINGRRLLLLLFQLFQGSQFHICLYFLLVHMRDQVYGEGFDELVDVAHDKISLDVEWLLQLFQPLL